MPCVRSSPFWTNRIPFGTSVSVRSSASFHQVSFHFLFFLHERINLVVVVDGRNCLDRHDLPL